MEPFKTLLLTKAARLTKIKDLHETIENMSEEAVQLKSDYRSLCEEKEEIVKEKASIVQSIPGLIQTSELVRNLQTTISELEDELEEKRASVRNLSARANEMKNIPNRSIWMNSIDINFVTTT